MIWIAAVVLLGLIVVLAQLLLVYQKRAHDLRMKMAPMRRRIRDHRNTTADVFSKVQERGTARLEEVESALGNQGQRLDKARELMADLDGEEMLQMPEPPEEPHKEAPFDEDRDPEWEAQAAAARETAREVQAVHDSLESQLNEMGHDRDVIWRTLERMQAQFGEEAGGGKPSRRRKRRGAS